MIDRRLLLLAIVLFGGSRAASGQTPRSVERNAPPASDAVNATRLTDPYMPAYPSENRYRSRTAPQPAPYDPDAEYGFRNPGGVGRVREFYPPGNVFERGDDRVRTAQFDNGPSSMSRQYQLMAQRVGNERTRTFYNHMDNYSRPLNFGFGYGYGFGLYGYGSRFPY